MEHSEIPFKLKSTRLQHGERFVEISVDGLRQYDLVIVDLEVPRSSRGGGTIDKR
jgi:hypothetical protein